MAGCSGTNVDDAGRASGVLLGCLDDLGHNEGGEEEVADVVGAEVHLDAIYGESTLLDAHDSGAVDDDVDGGYIRPGENFFGSSADRLLTGEVDLKSAVVDIRVIFLKDCNTVLKFANGPTGEDEAGRGLRCLVYMLVSGHG